MSKQQAITTGKEIFVPVPRVSKNGVSYIHYQKQKVGYVEEGKNRAERRKKAPRKLRKLIRLEALKNQEENANETNHAV
jgi:hypothetical protein